LYCFHYQKDTRISEDDQSQLRQFLRDGGLLRIKTVCPDPMIFATGAPLLDVLKERDLTLVEKTDLQA